MNLEHDKHPSSLSDAERDALVASDPDAFDEERPASPDPAATPADADQPADGAAAAATPAADGDDDSKPVDKRAFNGVLSELRDLRQSEREARRELQELREKFAAPPAPDRDFDAEKAELKAKFDNGDMLEDEYQEAREALILEQAEARAVAKLEAQSKAQAEAAAKAVQAQSNQDWDAQMNAWVAANADFCANPLRVQALATLAQTIGADPKLTHEQVIAQMEKDAFEAFNWKRAPAAAADHSARNAADAAAAAKASATPPPLSAGVGVGGRGSGETGVDLSSLKPGQFSKLPKAEQVRLLGEGAIDD